MEFKKNVLDRFRLDGKTAVITGAAGNIGYHTALAFAQAGANVAIVDLPQCLERSKQVAEEFAGLYGGKAAAYGCDLVDAKAVAEMFDAIEKELGSVDVVHNNAGVGGALVPDLEAWDSEHNMASGALETGAQYQPGEPVHCGDHGGQGDGAGGPWRQHHQHGLPDRTHSESGSPLGHTQDDSSYGVSKAGVLYFTKHFASQVIQYGIRVNYFSAGYCYSPGLHAGMSQEMLECYQNTQPIMRMAQVEELQGAVLYLASDASTYTVGQDILIDGGHANW